MTTHPKLNHTIIVAGALLFFGGLAALAITGRDPGVLAALLGGPAVSSVVGALLVKSTAVVRADLGTVQEHLIDQHHQLENQAQLLGQVLDEPATAVRPR